MEKIDINQDEHTRLCPFCGCGGYDVECVHCHDSTVSGTKYDIWICNKCGALSKETADGHTFWVSADNQKMGSTAVKVKKSKKATK